MARKRDINKLSEEELLATRLCNLPVRIERTHVDKAIARVKRELKSRRLSFVPHFWISDEWFCPDGIPGLAVPFFVLHPRLQKLERRFVGEVEGGNFKTCMKLLRHELGHVLDNAYYLRRKKRRQQIFGPSSTPYPDSYMPKLYSRAYVQHLGLGYAQSHPDEDFAETFAVWLTPGAGWRRKYQGTQALEKLEYMDSLMKEIKGRRAFRRSRDVYQPLSRMKMTLSEYYTNKRAHLGLIEGDRSIDRSLKEAFTSASAARSRELLSEFIASRKEELKREVASGVGEYHYRVEWVIQDVKKRAEKLGLTARSSSRETKQQILDILVDQSLRYRYSGRYRVVM